MLRLINLTEKGYRIRLYVSKHANRMACKYDMKFFTLKVDYSPLLDILLSSSSTCADPAEYGT